MAGRAESPGVFTLSQLKNGAVLLVVLSLVILCSLPVADDAAAITLFASE